MSSMVTKGAILLRITSLVAMAPVIFTAKTVEMNYVVAMEMIDYTAVMAMMFYTEKLITTNLKVNKAKISYTAVMATTP